MSLACFCVPWLLNRAWSAHIFALCVSFFEVVLLFFIYFQIYTRRISRDFVVVVDGISSRCEQHLSSIAVVLYVTGVVPCGGCFRVSTWNNPTPPAMCGPRPASFVALASFFGVGVLYVG